jgi:hypothetical protein
LKSGHVGLDCVDIIGKREWRRKKWKYYGETDHVRIYVAFDMSVQKGCRTYSEKDEKEEVMLDPVKMPSTLWR